MSNKKFPGGELILIKNGNVKHKELNYDFEEMQMDTEANPNAIKPFKSIEEQKLIEKSGVLAQTSEELYTELARQGYTVISLKKSFYHYEEYYTECSITIPNEVTENDYEIIKTTLEAIPENIRFTYVKALFKENGIEDFSYYNGSTRIPQFKEFAIKELEHRIGKLSQAEEELYRKSHEYDLEYILAEDSESKFVINNRNSGVLVITPDSTWGKPLIKHQHGIEINYILENLISGYDSSYSSDIVKDVYDTESILMQFNYGEAIIWLPEQLNEYQYTEMLKFIDEVKYIQINNKIGIYTAICKGRDFDSIEEFDLEESTENLSTVVENIAHIKALA